jgi:xanthine dehydrogenase YagS FAD-binding subunit
VEKFSYINPARLEQVPGLLKDDWQSKVIAGGTDLVGEMKDYIESPKRLINLKSIPGLDQISADDGGLTIGAMATLTDITEHSEIQKNYTALAEAAGVVASPQIRNVGTLGGNLCQRPRCWYYRDPDTDCLKKGGNMCYALSGLNKYNAIFGGGPNYIVHPSDTAPALVALGAEVTILGAGGQRTIPLENFFILPTVANPYRENILEPNEIITQIHLPKPIANTTSFYIKLRERSSFDFALVSIAGVFQTQGKKCQDLSLILGGVAPAPWRSNEAEQVLRGQVISDDLGERAGKAAVKNADPMSDNAYKVTLTQNLVKRAAVMAVS